MLHRVITSFINNFVFRNNCWCVSLEMEKSTHQRFCVPWKAAYFVTVKSEVEAHCCNEVSLWVVSRAHLKPLDTRTCDAEVYLRKVGQTASGRAQASHEQDRKFGRQHWWWHHSVPAKGLSPCKRFWFLESPQLRAEQKSLPLFAVVRVRPALIRPKGGHPSRVIGGVTTGGGPQVMLYLPPAARWRVTSPPVSTVVFCLWNKVIFASCLISLTPAWPGGRERCHHHMRCLHVGGLWLYTFSQIRLCGWWLRTHSGWPFYGQMPHGKVCESPYWWYYTGAMGPFQWLHGRNKICPLLVYSACRLLGSVSFLWPRHRSIVNCSSWWAVLKAFKEFGGFASPTVCALKAFPGLRSGKLWVRRKQKALLRGLLESSREFQGLRVSVQCSPKW